MQRFRFARPHPAMAALFWVVATPPDRCWVGVDERQVLVRLGWAFQADVPRSAVLAADHDHGGVGMLGYGAHGLAGRWLVNTSSKGLVRLELEPAAELRARVLGVSVRLTTLRLSLADPDGFLAALG
jgi:hypothetical protein